MTLNKDSIVLFSNGYKKEALEIGNRLLLSTDGTVTLYEISLNFIPYAEKDTLIYDKGKFGVFKTVVIIFPLFYEDSEFIYRKLSSIEQLSGLILLVSVPDKRLISKPIYKTLQEIYMKSFNNNKASLLKKATQYLKILDGKKNFTFIDKRGSKLHFLRESLVWVDVFNNNKHGVFQIPGGEVFFAIKNYSANGEIYIGDKKYTVVDNVLVGDVYDNNNVELMVCEFGLGVNDIIPRCLVLDIAEKSYGTCHFGFGNNRNFGGTIDAGYHFDVTYKSFSLCSGNEILVNFI